MNNTLIEGDEVGIDILNEAINESMFQDIGIKHENLMNLLIKIEKTCDELFIDKEKLIAIHTVNCN